MLKGTTAIVYVALDGEIKMSTEAKNYTEIDGIRDLTDLLDKLGKIQETQELVWYRGQKNRKDTLVPSVFRKDPIKQTTYVEQVMMHEFMKRAGQIIKDVPDSKEYAKWLPIMQHYGLPTRLLDWTTAPLVALYFATLPSVSSEADESKQKVETDGALWCINPNKLNEGILKGSFVPPINYESTKYLTKCAFEKDADDKCRAQIMACTCVGSYLRMFTQQANFTIHSKSLQDLTKLKEVNWNSLTIDQGVALLLPYNNDFRVVGLVVNAP